MSTSQVVEIVGNTYPVKDQLRALGGRWNSERKAWMVPAERAAEAKRLVSSGGRSGTYRAAVSATVRCHFCGRPGTKDCGAHM